MNPAIETPDILLERNRATAVDLLIAYFQPATHEQAFTGSRFETLGQRWDDPAADNVITAADLLSLSALSVQLDIDSVIAMLEPDFQERSSELLRRIPVDLELVDDGAEGVEDEGSPALELWHHLRMRNVASTRVSKLMARKRPRLVPIYDSVVSDVLGLESSERHWTRMREWLLRDERAVYSHAVSLHRDAQLSNLVTPLRTIDVVLWMHGKG